MTDPAVHHGSPISLPFLHVRAKLTGDRRPGTLRWDDTLFEFKALTFQSSLPRGTVLFVYLDRATFPGTRARGTLRLPSIP